jgi:pilus assembly protein CpaB
MRRGGRLFLLLGILLIVAAALAYFVITQPQVTPPELTPQATQELKRPIVIARIDIPNNTVLTDTATFLGTIDIPESEYNSAAGQYFTSPEQLLNKQTVRQINFNERIRRSDITEPGLSILIPTAQPNQPRPKAYPVQVNNLSGVADQIRPGDFVDVLASFDIQRTIIRPSFSETGQIILKEEPLTGHSTKALIQNVQVLQILKPAVPEGTPGAQGGAQPAQQQPAGPPQTNESGQPVQQGQQGQQTVQPAGPQTTGTFQPGDWLLVLALTDQQAEIVKYSVETGTITLALRARGDAGVDTTFGSTLQILVEQFGLPLPGAAVPEVISPSDLTPVPTVAAPANAGPTATLSPTPTPR